MNSMPLNKETPASEDSGRNILGELEQLLDAQRHEEVVEIDPEGRIVPVGEGTRWRGAKSTILHDPRGEYADGVGFKVPRRLLMSPDEMRLGKDKRMHIEQEKLKVSFPQFGFIARSGVLAAIKGILKTSREKVYSIAIELPADYPYSAPVVLPDGWVPCTGTPHRYANGAICLLKPAQWSSNFTVALTVAKVAIWLNKYEVWLERKVWPGHGQEH